MRVDPNPKSVPDPPLSEEKPGGPAPADPIDEPVRPGHEAPAPAPKMAADEAWSAAPVGADEGRMVAVPGLEPAPGREDGAPPASRTEKGVSGQLLTGRGTRVGLPAVSLSPTQLAWRKLKKNRLAVAGGIVLIVLYVIAVFAPFIAPYTYASQDPAASFWPPMVVHFTPWLTVYPSTSSFNEYRERIYVEDRSQPRPLRFFTPGESYLLLGFIPVNVHLFGGSGGRASTCWGPTTLAATT